MLMKLPSLHRGKLNRTTKNNNENQNKQEITCQTISLGQADGACDSAVDCVCDPDCGVDNQPPDPDCEKSASSAGKNNTIFIIAGLIILIIINCYRCCSNFFKKKE